MAASDLERLIQLLGTAAGAGAALGAPGGTASAEEARFPDAAVGGGARRGRGQRQDLRESAAISTARIPAPSAAIPSAIPAVICVVAEVGDLWALERSATYRGRYHVLGGTLSALDGIGPEQLNLAGLLRRAGDPVVQEVVLATGATVEGQTTAHYIADRLAGLPVTVSRLAHGLPVGGELDYLDDGTLMAALKARRPL